jgi:hypothetical protein
LLRTRLSIVASTRPVTTLQEPNKIAIPAVQLKKDDHDKFIYDREDPETVKASFTHTEREWQKDRPCIR